LKRLSLKREHLAELTAGELRQARGAGADSFTGKVDCILSLEQPCVSAICVSVPIWVVTLLCGA